MDFNPEFSHLHEVRLIPPKGMHISLEANEEERARICKRLDLVALDYLKAEIDLSHEDNNHIRAIGRFSARTTQSCIITLSPIVNKIEDEISGLFIPEDQIPEDDESIELSEDMEVFDPIINGEIDLGELTVQCLSLCLDPYPRSPDSELVKKSANNNNMNDNTQQSPFAVLADLVKDKE